MAAAGFSLTVRDSAGAVFGGTTYARGAAVPTADSEVLQRALAEVGHQCDISRLTAPGGQVPLDLAMRETMAANNPTPAAFNGLAVDAFVDPLTASTNAIKLSIASVASPVTYSGAQLDGAVGQSGQMVPARNITVTSGGTAAQCPNSVVVTGTGPDGKPQTETITLSQTATTDSGVKPFRTVSSLAFSTGSGTAGTLAIGFGPVMGLTQLPKVRDAKFSLFNELTDGAKPATGAVLVPPATAPPFGTVAPNSAANGARDYQFFYEKA